MELTRRIEDVGADLTPAERRVAEVVLADPRLVAFGTVAEVARAAGAGAATVLRLAAKLGLEGFTGLQARAQEDVTASLGPAAERIRAVGPDDLGHPHAATEVANVEATLAAARPEVVDAVVDLLADPRRTVLVAASASAAGVATQFADDLGGLRAGVERLDGNQVAVLRRLAGGGEEGRGPAGALLAIDVARYDRWLLDAFAAAGDGGWARVALTDGALSPLARAADHALVIAVDSATPFESHVGTLALLDRLVLGVAERGRDAAARRLARVEAAWQAREALVDE